jgi:hypothetical protein
MLKHQEMLLEIPYLSVHHDLKRVDNDEQY